LLQFRLGSDVDIEVIGIDFEIVVS